MDKLYVCLSIMFIIALYHIVSVVATVFTHSSDSGAGCLSQLMSCPGGITNRAHWLASVTTKPWAEQDNILIH